MKTSILSRKGCVIYFLSAAAVFELTACLAFSASEGSGGGITVIPDKSVFIQIANFLILIWALNMILYKPIRKILRQRKEKIDGLELAIETYNRDIQETEEAFVSGLKAARTSGLAQKGDVVQAAAEEEKKIIESVNHKAQAELAAIREKIAGDIESVKTSLQERVDEFANDISQKILGRTV